MDSLLKNILNSFTPISLDAVGKNALMKRVCTKFIVNEKSLSVILKDILPYYSILEINNAKVHGYSSLYFDTVTKKFYNDHHNKRANRIKVRIRKYEENNLYFLEIKQKNAKGVTNKSRIPIESFEEPLSSESLDYIKDETSHDFNLVPSISNNFKRATLVNKVNKERLTLDFNLSDKIDSYTNTYEDLVIIEVKQPFFSQSSPIVKTLKKYGYHPFSISKYCIGMVNHYKELKYNRFKTKLLKINKLTR